MALNLEPGPARPPQHVWLQSYRPGRFGGSYRFEEPVGQVVAGRLDEVPAALDRVAAAVSAGVHAVGVVTYEAGPAFDPALAAYPGPGGRVPWPVAWFGLYRARRALSPNDEGGPDPDGEHELGAWTARLSEVDHARAVSRIRTAIAAGDVYQVNLTFPVAAEFRGDAGGLYSRVCRAQGSAAFCAYLDFGELAVVSASPELFFALDGDGHIETRPMKGTCRRGRWAEEDDERARALAASPKDRAENVMIVDLLRNDLGRVSGPGSVTVPALWQVERLDTVWQMTSTVAGRLRPEVGLADLFGALFPCGSVTGAPKIQATRMIRQLEIAPRGVYTGSIGYLSPAGDPGGGRLRGVEARFSVAIRTLTVERRAGRVSAGVGGGITWDSEPAAEYSECLDKGRFLESPRSEFDLYEALLFEPGKGYYLLARHLQRLGGSARYFGFPFDEAEVRARLDAAVAWAPRPTEVCLTVAGDGTLEVVARPLAPPVPLLTTVVAPDPVHSEDRFLYHGTTHRPVHDLALRQARAAGAGEAVLFNERAEVTETTAGNLVVARGAQRLTPPLDSGLLPGTLRAELLAAGRLEERVLAVADLAIGAEVYRIDSVCRWVRLELAPETQIPPGRGPAAVRT